MSVEANKALVRKLFEDGLNNGNVDEWVELTSPDFFDHNVHAGTNAGAESLREALIEIRTGFPDVDVTIEDMIAEGDRVVVRNTWRGTHLGVFGGIAPTGRRIEIGGIVIWRVQAGKIAERWAYLDTPALYDQLGLTSDASASD